MRDMERMMFEFEEDFERRLATREGKEFRPIVYGVRITIGPDGRPVIEEFGNVKHRGRRPIVEESIEPLVDVIDEKDHVTVVTEIPGADKDKIDVRVKDNKLIIRAEGNGRKYYREVRLPAGVKPDTAKAKYKNGVLEITIEKEQPKEEQEGTRIKVE